MKKDFKKFVILCVGLILILLTGILVLNRNKVTVLKQRAAFGGVTVSFESATTSIAKDQDFEVKVMINSGTQKVSGVDLTFSFPADKMHFVSYARNNQAFTDEISVTSGGQLIRFVAVNKGTTLKSGTFVAVTLTFKGLVVENGVRLDLLGTGKIVGENAQSQDVELSYSPASITYNFTQGTTRQCLKCPIKNYQANDTTCLGSSTDGSHYEWTAVNDQNCHLLQNPVGSFYWKRTAEPCVTVETSFCNGIPTPATTQPTATPTIPRKMSPTPGTVTPSATPTPTILPPTCIISINSPGSVCTTSRTVSLHFSTEAEGGTPTEMQVWNDGGPTPAETSWQPYKPVVDNWVLNGAPLSKVWARLRNSTGVSNRCMDVINFPCPSPTPTPTVTWKPCSACDISRNNKICNEDLDSFSTSGCFNKAVTSSNGCSAYDMNSDDYVDLQDLVRCSQTCYSGNACPTPVATNTPTSTSTPPACACPTASVPAKALGNANCDNNINREDLNLWINRYAGADFNCDNSIDRLDLNIWINYYTR